MIWWRWVILVLAALVAVAMTWIRLAPSDPAVWNIDPRQIDHIVELCEPLREYGLDLDDIDTRARSVLLHGKGGKQRLVPVGRPAVGALDAYLVRGRPALVSRNGPALFLNVRGGRLSRQSAWQVLQNSAERAGISAHVSPHTLRHSFATHLLDGGADVRVVQELLGHASVTTTQIYTLVTVGSLREVWAGAHPRAR